MGYRQAMAMARGEPTRSRAASPIPLPAPEKQRKAFAARANVKMQELHFWCPLCIKWWQAWKAYTRYEEVDDQGVAALSLNDDVTPVPPGPIDNSDLLGPEPDELKQGLGEGEDFVLLPAAAYELLEAWYGGGPKFKRVVLAEGNTKPPTLLVELYPLRFRTYRCLPSGLPDMLSCRSELFSRSKTMSQVRATLLNSMGIPHENARIFVKVLEPTAESPRTDRDSWVMVDGAAISPADAAKPAANGFGNGASATAPMDVVPAVAATAGSDGAAAAKAANGFGGPEGAGCGRRSGSQEEEDDSDGWKAVDINNSNRTLDEMLGGMQGVVNLLLDVRESESEPYPREQILQRWRNKLKVGDMVDARDSDSNWLEAKVMSFEPNGEIKVHFLGWAPKWDMSMSVTDPALEPVHTHTPNWRSLLAPGYQLEVRKQENGKWFEGKVVSVPPEHPGKVLVEFSPDAGTPAGERRILAIYGDDINRLGTHIRKDSKLAASGVQTRSGALLGASEDTGYGGSWYGKINTRGTPLAKGAVGLNNLGNTCFMNSTLQCLSNTEPLTKWFLNNGHKHDLNVDNPLGMNGKVALSYARVLEELWSGSFSTVVPSDLKRTIGKLQTQFAGFQQHDSQELMNFLLDGLHEDLNRVRKKPVVEKMDSDGRPDEEVAAESWERFLMRNDSVVVDHCYGLLKSHVTCPVCNYESVTFDPYSLLSLPLPVDSVHKLDATLFLQPYSRSPVKITFMGPPMTTIAEVKEWIVTHVAPAYVGGRQVDARKLAAYDIWNHHVHSHILDSRHVSDIKIHEHIFFYEVEQPPPEKPFFLPGLGASSSSTHYNTVSSSGPTIILSEAGVMTAAPAAAAAAAASAASDDAGMDIDEEVPLSAGAAAAGAAAGSGSSAGSVTEKGSSAEAEQPVAAVPPVAFDMNFVKANNISHVKIAPLLRLCLPAPVTHRRVSEIAREAIRRFYKPAENGKDFLTVTATAAGAEADGARGPSAATAAAAAGGGAAAAAPAVEGKEPEMEKDAPYRVLVHPRHGPFKAVGEVGESDEELVLSGLGMHGTTQHYDVNVVFSSSGAACLDEQAAEFVEEHESVAGAAKPPTPISLGDCFDKFMEREQLSDKDPWYCSRCKEHREAFKQMSLWTTPDILIVHLKRFQYLPGSYPGSQFCRSKLEPLVDFPVEGLDLSRYLDRVGGPRFPENPPLYDLYGVSEHMGSLRGGHYTAVAKNFLDGRWYSFNDTRVEETKAEEAVSPRAYVLFYRRRAAKPLRWGGMGHHSLESGNGMQS